MRNFDTKNLQINFNQAENALTIPAELRHDHKCGSATQCGRSMIEMLGVLAIIGVLSVGGIAGYSKAMQKYRINKTIEQITLIAGNVRTFFAPQGNYDGLSSYSDTGKAIIKKAKLVPDEMWNGDNIQDVWGNNVNITGGGKYFSIDFTLSSGAIPVEACIELVTQDWSDTGKTFVAIMYYPSMPKYNIAPLSLETATTLCYEATQKTTSNLSFAFDNAPF
ncbi:MAG: hypothetical protein IJ525_03015 [Alphaproteobacteria bacterium]|nr:hypothetical protein [Alphaproteobacteria bacterium]